MPPVVKGFLCSVYELCKKQPLSRPMDSFLSSLEMPTESNDRTEQPGGGVSPPTHLLSVHPTLPDTLSDTRVSNLGDCVAL